VRTVPVWVLTIVLARVVIADLIAVRRQQQIVLCKVIVTETEHVFLIITVAVTRVGKVLIVQRSIVTT